MHVWAKGNTHAVETVISLFYAISPFRMIFLVFCSVIMNFNLKEKIHATVAFSKVFGHLCQIKVLHNSFFFIKRKYIVAMKQKKNVWYTPKSDSMFHMKCSYLIFYTKIWKKGFYMQNYLKKDEAGLHLWAFRKNSIYMKAVLSACVPYISLQMLIYLHETWEYTYVL